MPPYLGVQSVSIKQLGVITDWISGDPRLTDVATYNPLFKDTTSFFSEYHKKINGRWDGGGPFQVSHRTYEHNPSQSIIVTHAGTNRPAYNGSFICNTGLTIPGPPVMKDLGILAPKFYNDAAPDKPLMGLANALYELKDVPGMLQDRFLDKGFNGMSNLSLAYQFGWKPLLQDVRNLYETQCRLKKALEQLEKDNGKPVRRRIENKINKSTSLVSESFGGYPNLYPGFVTQCYGPTEHTRNKIEYVEENVEWYSAQYRYWLPDKGTMPTWQWRAWMIGRLYGLKVTPAVVYNAIPWSWLLDWFTTTGDAVANLDHGVADRLINDYAFVMGTQRNYHQYTNAGAFNTGTNGKYTVVTAVSKFGHVYKRRLHASPFGFNIKDDDLNAGQIAILGNLANSKR
jgi:hypothetical protein